MNPWWLYTILAITTGTTIAAIIILVGHETEERPGYIDLTGSRVRAEAGPVVFGPESREAREVHAMFGQIPLDGHGDPVSGYLRIHDAGADDAA